MRTLTMLLLAGLLIASAGCRDGPLCIQTLRATCRCDDPLRPDVRSCVAYADVVSCDPDAGVDDVCRINPCCRLAVGDGGSTSDAGDGGSADAGGNDASAALR